MKRLLAIAGLLVLMLSLVPGVFAQAPSPGSGTSFGAVQNVDPTGSATFVQQFYDISGNLDATREMTNVAYGDTMGLTTDASRAPLTTGDLPVGWVGSSVVQSDREAAAVVLIQYVNGQIGADGVTTADYSGVLNPGSDVFCASVGKRNNEDTTLIIQNASAVAATDVTVSFKTRDGANVGTPKTFASIPAYAQVSLNLFATELGLPADFLGAARVQSASGKLLAVVALSHWQGGTFAVNCQPTLDAATTLYAPKVQRRAQGGAIGNWLDSTGIVVVNTESTNATVQVKFYQRDGTFEGQFTDTVPAFSARGYNTEYIANANPAIINSLVGSGTAADPFWQGSAVIVSTTGQKLVGIVKQSYEKSQWAGGYAMLSDADGATDWFFPLVYRRGFNKPWTDYVGFICQNVSVNNVAPRVEFVDRSATATKCTASTTECAFTDATPFGQYVSHGYNTRYGANAPSAAWFGDPNSGAIGNNIAGNFLGAAFLTSSQPIVCIQETWAEEVYSNGWINGGDANLNNVYGR